MSTRAAPGTSALEARDGSSLTLFAGNCAGDPLRAVVTSQEIQSGCHPVTKFNSFVADGAYWGWKVYSDPYCLTLAQVAPEGLCFAILGEGALSISYD